MFLALSKEFVDFVQRRDSYAREPYLSHASTCVALRNKLASIPVNF